MTPAAQALVDACALLEAVKPRQDTGRARDLWSAVWAAAEDQAEAAAKAWLDEVAK